MQKCYVICLLETHEAHLAEKQRNCIASGLVPIGFLPNRPGSIHGGFSECKEFVKNSGSELGGYVKSVGTPKRTLLTNAGCTGIMLVQLSVEREILLLKGRPASQRR